MKQDFQLQNTVKLATIIFVIDLEFPANKDFLNLVHSIHAVHLHLIPFKALLQYLLTVLHPLGNLYVHMN